MDFSSLRLLAIMLAALLAGTLFVTVPAAGSEPGAEVSGRVGGQGGQPAAGRESGPDDGDDGDGHDARDARDGAALQGVRHLTGAAGIEPGELARRDRPRLRAVSTAPLRPRLAEGAGRGRPPADLRVLNARLRIDDASDIALEQALATPGVRFATRFFAADLPVSAEEGDATLRVAFVDPARFRTFTPALTATVEPVWKAATAGEVLLTHGAGRTLGLGAGDEVTLTGEGQQLETRVGALVSLGRGGVADAIMSTAAMDDLGVRPPTGMLVAVERLKDIPAVAERLAAADIGAVSGVADLTPFRSELVGSDEATVAAFEPFEFVPGRGGAIAIDKGWVERNIVKADVPILGEVACHRLIIPQLRAALAEIQEAGLAKLIDANDYGGCYNPRHIDRNPAKSLSMHAWGISFDINVQANLLGAEPQLDERIVEIFEQHGFNWGGHWRRPDGMHFELGVLQEQ